MRIYGILDSNDAHIDTSKTLTGAKQYATRHGYTTVSRRDSNHYYVNIVAVKSPRGNWLTPEQAQDSI
jgi:hypothetical protein